MPCKKCMVFISDTLLQPPCPTSPHYGSFKQKRLAGCLQPLSYLFARHIETSRPDMHEWLNMMEMMNCAVLNQTATRDYRMYQIWRNEKTDVESMLTLLLENSILAKCRDKQVYEEWFAEKSMFLLSTVRQIHLEHSRNVPVWTHPPIHDEYNGLYS